MAETQISLPQFCTMLMRCLNMAEYPTPVQMQILHYLEHGPKRRTVCAFRGCGKSTLSAMFILWKLFHNPEEKILILSASMTRAEAMSAWLLKTIGDVPWLRHMLPDSHDGRYSRIAFDVGTCQHIEQSPSVRAAGITGQITGSRASLILADDVETVQTSLTQVQREKLRSTLSELEAILKPGEGPQILYLGTPHSSTDSIYFALKRDLNYDIKFFPARVPSDITPYVGCLAEPIERRVGKDDGRPTDTRFSDEELTERELSMSPMNWRMQFQLDPSLSDAERYPLKCADMMVITVDQHLPEVMVYEKAKHLALDDLPCVGFAHDSRFYRPLITEGTIPVDQVPTVLALDPSGGGADEFAYSVVKAYSGNYFVLASGGRLGGVNEAWWLELATIAKKYGVNEILVETNFGGLALYEGLLKAPLRQVGAECRIEPVRANQQKELRIIDTLAPVLQTHRLAFDRRVIEKDAELVKNSKDEKGASYSLMVQATRLTHDRGALLHDDRLDALATAIAWLQEQAAQDQKIQMASRAVELLNAEFEDETGYALMSLDRQALGMSLEQARMSEVKGGSRGGSWI